MVLHQSFVDLSKRKITKERERIIVRTEPYILDRLIPEAKITFRLL